MPYPVVRNLGPKDHTPPEFSFFACVSRYHPRQIFCSWGPALAPSGDTNLSWMTPEMSQKAPEIGQKARRMR
jgi:hypothetical protein